MGKNIDEMYGGAQKRKFVAETMTAEQARARTEAAAKIKAETELLPIFNKIDEACRIGMYSVDYTGDLSDAALKRLTELGYEYIKIGTTRPMDEEFAPMGIRISWEKIK